MEEVSGNSKPMNLDSSDLRKNPTSGALHGNIHAGKRGNVTQEEECEVMVISDDSNHGVNNCNGLHTSVLPSQDQSKFGIAEQTFNIQNGSDFKEFLGKKSNIHKQKQRTLNRTSDEHCNIRNKNAIEEVVISETCVEKDDSRETVEDQGESSINSLKYNFDNPLMALNYMGEFKTPEDNFTKGCKWSPDGSCLLVTANDSKIRLFNLPAPVLQGKFQCESWFAEEAEKYSKPAVTVREKEIVYDYCWYPQMRSDLPSSCCFAATCRDHPIHLWDAWDGHLICSYHPYNHLDEMVAAYSVEFNIDGSQLVAGFSKCLRTFHTHRPGRYFEEIEAKKQPGIISCMSFNPQLPSVFAAGSYLGSVGLYNLERNNLFCRMDGNIGGVTQVKFSSCGTKLFSGSRKNNEILCWDIRNPGTLLCGFKRQVSTSQRIYFDLEPHYNRFLVSGDTGGRILKWDLDENQETPGSDDFTKEPSSAFMAHKDCTNGVSIHPYCPLLATSSGQRHFPEPVSGSDVDSCSESEEPQVLFTSSRIFQENTVKLWWLAGS